MSDPFDPNTWEMDRVCHIYDADLERFAIVDEAFYSQLITMRDTNPNRTGGLISRRWRINKPHPRRNGQKKYFINNAGWRTGSTQITFLHVEVMRLAGIEPPTLQHVIVNHIDGDEWNCRQINLEWATHADNRRKSRQK